jgi:hypothetical protein
MTQDPADPSEKRKKGTTAKRSPKQDQEEKQLLPREIGGPKGLEPTRYGDWEQNGRCSDF